MQCPPSPLPAHVTLQTNVFRWITMHLFAIVLLMILIYAAANLQGSFLVTLHRLASPRINETYPPDAVHPIVDLS